MKAKIAWTLCVILLPVAITACFKLTEVSIGPVVFFYPVLGGIILGIVWGHAVRQRYGIGIALAAGVIVTLIGYTILINGFIGITAAMGEMDYSLM
jgi:hypothetical protein